MRHGLMVAALAMGALTACGGDAGSGADDVALTDTASMVDTPAPMEPSGATAQAQLLDASGQQVGTATLTETGAGVEIAVQVNGLPPGPHGIHVHETGTCTAPDFASAGAHFNPTQRQHGLQNPEGSHVGDLPNLEVGADGTGTGQLLANEARLSEGPNALLDADGAALVIHADADDNVTDPSGNSGGRIACGVITAQ